MLEMGPVVPAGVPSIASSNVVGDTPENVLVKNVAQ
jgi:hypothetical protein